MKYCWECKQNKEEKEFYRNRSKKDGFHDSCKSCSNNRRKKRIAKDPERERKRGREKAKRCRNTINAQQKKARKENPKKFKNWYYKKLYGITLDQYNQKLKDQDFCCAICKINIKDLNKNLAVDHNHQTGKIRSLLCIPCNSYLGRIKESFDAALRLAKYIQEDSNCL